MEALRNQALLCQEIESELRELCLECRKKFPIIKEYTERAILKIRQHKELAEQDGRAPEELPEFPLDEVLRAILMACETFQNRIVLLSLSCLQRLIHRRVLKDETIAIVINLMKEQATNGDEQVQLRVLQTVMATPSRMTLLNELVVEQLMQLLYVLHNSPSASVHHTACAGLVQLAEKMADRAASEVEGEVPLTQLEEAARPVLRRVQGSLPTVQPSQAPATLSGPLRMFYVFVQDLCVMADYDASSLSSRYAVDSAERMRTGLREGYWLATIKFPRPLCLELLGTCVAAHPTIFTGSPECFALLRHNLCAALQKNLKGCFDFAILIRSIHLLQQLLKSPRLAALLMPELQVFLHLMLDLTTAERSPWQRATSLEFLKSVCEDPVALAVLYEHGSAMVRAASREGSTSPASGSTGAQTFLEIVNSLSKLIHQVCFERGTDSASLLQSGGASAAAAASSASSTGVATAAAAAQRAAANFDVGRGLLLLGNMNLPQLLGGGGFPGLGLGAAGSSLGGARDVFASGGGASADGTGSGVHWTPGGASGGGGGGGGGGGARGSLPPPRIKLLLLMSETDPPVIQPAFLCILVMESVFAVVSTLYRLLLDTGEEPVLPSTSDCNDSDRSGSMDAGHRFAPLTGKLTPTQERCRAMVSDTWASLLSALSLLLQGTADEACLQQALRCLQTLLYCCSRLDIRAGREACLQQLSRYALPGPGHEAEPELLGQGTPVAGGLPLKNVRCFKALLHFCYCFGGLLGVEGWTIALKAFVGLEKILNKAKAQAAQSAEVTALRHALDSLFETTAVLREEALIDIVDAMSNIMAGVTDGDDGGTLGRRPEAKAPRGKDEARSDSDDGSALLKRLEELCSYNLGRLLTIWNRVLRIITDVCKSPNCRGEFRGAAATALCHVLAQALKRGALATVEKPEAVQDELLKHLEVLLRVPHEDARARVAEGLLGILQASGQDLHPAAWGTMIHLVAMAARVELERAGLEFLLPKALDPILSNGSGPSDSSAGEASLPQMNVASFSVGTAASETRDTSQVLPTVFQLLELLVQDFMEYVPPGSVPHITASIGAFARFTGLGVNSSLTAVGFLWNVADALARYHCTPAAGASPDLALAAVPLPNGASAVLASGGAGGGASAAEFEDLWVQIFMHLRVLSVDGRPEVRNCAVKSLTSALVSHGRKIGTACYQRCLRDILIEVVVEIQQAANQARTRERSASLGPRADAGLLVHHSRDTPEKQWNETVVLGVEGVRRVLAHFSEEAGVRAFAPLAYTVLLQLQHTLRSLSSELSGSALRALVDLMRIPASSQCFDASVLPSDPALPVASACGAGGTTTSVWLLGWVVLWGVAQFCMPREVPESLMETFEKSLNSLRNTHRHNFSPAQHVMLLQISMVLTTSPCFYLPTCAPLAATDPPVPPPAGGSQADDIDHEAALEEAVRLCVEDSPAALTDAGREVFAFAAAGPRLLWDVQARTAETPGAPRTYAKAPTAVQCLVTANQSKNFDIRSMESALLEICQASGTQDEITQAFLGPGRSPTHRTMLHISSSRLQHVQGFAFGLLEDTQGFPEPGLEVLFLYQCCAMYLDVRRVLQDTNKVALAARALCLLVLFCRRVLLNHLSRLARPGADVDELAAEADHLEAMLGKAIPHLCKVVSALACGRGRSDLRQCGLWKLAIEALVYLVEDSLPALERCSLGPATLAAYWGAVSSSLSDAVSLGLPGPSATTSRAAGGAASWSLPPAECADADLLAQALGNLIAHRILACAVAPPQVLEACVALLEALAGHQSELAVAMPPPAAAREAPPGAGAPPSGDAGAAESTPEWTNLRHLFDLCDAPGEEGASSPSCGEEDSKQSVAAMSARGGAAASVPRGAIQRHRADLIGIAVPALLARVRALLAAHARVEAGAAGATSQRAEEVRFVLSRLRDFQADEAAVAAATAGGSDRGRAACELAGAQGLIVAVLPQLAGLATSKDPGVRGGTRAVLEAVGARFAL